MDKRARAMAVAYGSGLSLSDVGAQFGLTGSRVGQILRAAGVARRVGGDKIGAKQRALARARGIARTAHLKGKTLVPELDEAVKLVREGATYSEAAAALGITRNQVAGICHRKCVKAPLDNEKRERWALAISLAKKGWWASLSEKERRDHVARMTAGHHKARA